MSMDYLASHFNDVLKSTTVEIISQKKDEIKKTFKPNFLRSEQVFDDILPVVDKNEFYELNYIGVQGHGKSFSASEFATLAEREGFLVIYGKAEEVMTDLIAWKDKVIELILSSKKIKLCIILDDMSYSNATLSPKKSAAWKHFVGDIRHQFEDVLGDGIKPKIFLIFISHRYHSVPPIMRNAKTWIFASMLAQDRKDAQELIPKNKEETEKLDEIYHFLEEVTMLGPKYKTVPLTHDGKEFIFHWGDKDDPGDGRLMMIYHSGKMQIFNPRRQEGMIELDDKRIKISQNILNPVGPATVQNMPSYIPKKASEGWRKITCQFCGNEQNTRRKAGELIQCAKCNKTIQKKDLNLLLKDGLEAEPVENLIVENKEEKDVQPDI